MRNLLLLSNHLGRLLKRVKGRRKSCSQRSIKSREASSKLSSDSDKISRSSRARRGGDITDAKIEVNSSTSSRRNKSCAETIELDKKLALSIHEDRALKISNRGKGTLTTFDDKITILRLCICANNTTMYLF